jgi:hypothetical protein
MFEPRVQGNARAQRWDPFVKRRHLNWAKSLGRDIQPQAAGPAVREQLRAHGGDHRRAGPGRMGAALGVARAPTTPRREGARLLPEVFLWVLPGLRADVAVVEPVALRRIGAEL